MEQKPIFNPIASFRESGEREFVFTNADDVHAQRVLKHLRLDALFDDGFHIGSAGYEPKLGGGHKQGSIESSNLVFKAGKWRLMAHAAVQGSSVRNWIWESDRPSTYSMTMK